MTNERLVNIGRQFNDDQTVMCYFESDDCEYQYIRILTQEQINTYLPYFEEIESAICAVDSEP